MSVKYSSLLTKLVIVASVGCLMRMVASNKIDKRDKIDKSFSVLLTSDLHMGLGNDAEQKKKLDAMIKYIKDSSKNVRGVILNGDLGGNYGKQSEADAFLSSFYYPLVEATKKKLETDAVKFAEDMKAYVAREQKYHDEVVSGKMAKKDMENFIKEKDFIVPPSLLPIYLGVGNHDTYYHSGIEEGLAKAFPDKLRNREIENFFVKLSGNEPYPTAMMRFIKEKHGAYQYSFMLGGVKFIALGLHPSKSFAGGIPTEKYFPSLDFLRVELAPTKKPPMGPGQKEQKDPVIIFFHYPMSGPYADWWSKAEKDAFYEAIKDYNILAILVGHAHGAAIYKFRGKIPTIQAAGAEFAVLNINPEKNYELDVSFVDGKGTIRPGSEFARSDTSEPDLKK